jgi:arylsulfatase
MATHVSAQTSLPYPDSHFKGFVGSTYLDSAPATFPQPVKAPKGAPNVLLILLDDVGFGQFAVTGGGVPSPSMEQLAKEGLLYNRFHTTALCSPTRAALLTGRNPQSSSTGIITELATGYDGYTGIIPQETATVAEVLRQNGYNTAWIGKNHNTPVWETSANGPYTHWATGPGFNYFYGFNAGDISQWEPILFENTNPVPRSTDQQYHLSTDLADKAIAWMRRSKEIEPEKPFFLYVAPAATHSPHHAPQAWIDKFKDQFDMGWDRYRELTFERQKKLGVIPANAVLTARPASLPAWESVPAAHKQLFARMMEIFAAYGAHVDHEMGRVIEAVKQLPDADNTMIIYIVGDNGASAEGGLAGSINEVAFFNGVVERVEDILPHLDELGGPKHFNHFPAMWAHAMNTPFQWTKQVASHFGGTRNPLIVSWPAKIKERGGVRAQFHHVSDIAPTILEAAGIAFPATVNGIEQKPIEGVSMAYTFDNAKAKDGRTAQIFEMFVNRGMYQDGWFAASRSFEPWNPVRGQFDPHTAKWELYNIDEDFTQAKDLAQQPPEKLAALEHLWWAEAARKQILPLDWRGAERFSGQLTGKPNLAAGRDTYVYRSGLSLLPEAAAPDLKNKSFTLIAEVELKQGDEGMLFTQGGFTGGWAFMVQKGKLVLIHNYIDLARYRVESTETLPTGKVTLVAHFAYGGGKEMGKSGTVTLSANGKAIGSGGIAKTAPFRYSLSETQDIGRDEGTPVDHSYRPPFAFTGAIQTFTVELK